MSGCLCRHGGSTGTAGSRDGGVHSLDCYISINGSIINIRSVKVRDLHTFSCGFIKKTTNIHFVHLAYICRKREENEKRVHSRDTLRFASCESRIFFFFFFFFFFTLITNKLALTYSLKYDNANKIRQCENIFVFIDLTKSIGSDLGGQCPPAPPPKLRLWL